MTVKLTCSKNSPKDPIKDTHHFCPMKNSKSSKLQVLGIMLVPFKSVAKFPFLLKEPGVHGIPFFYMCWTS